MGKGASLVAQTVKNLPAMQEDLGSIPGSGRSPGKGNVNPFQYPAWRIPWTEEPMGYNSWAHKELDTTEQLTYIYTYGKGIRKEHMYLYTSETLCSMLETNTTL